MPKDTCTSDFRTHDSICISSFCFTRERRVVLFAGGARDTVAVYGYPWVTSHGLSVEDVTIRSCNAQLETSREAETRTAARTALLIASDSVWTLAEGREGERGRGQESWNTKAITTSYLALDLHTSVHALINPTSFRGIPLNLGIRAFGGHRGVA